MGVFVYDSTGATIELPDRTLAHLQIVVVVKLRRRESFMLNITHTHSVGVQGYRSFWMHPSIPVQFHRSKRPFGKLNQLWVERLVNEASRPDGLWLVREPEETGEPETRTREFG